MSFWASRCATSMMIRCSASAASTALIDFSRDTERGRMMNGKTTTSFSGRTGRMSGIGRSGSRSTISFSSSSTIRTREILSFFFAADDGDGQLLFPLVGDARKNDLEHAALQLRDGAVRVDRA